MTREQRIEQAVSAISSNMIEVARASTEPVAFVTGNSYMPPLRSYSEAEAVWHYDGDHGTGDFELVVEGVESALSKANVLLSAPEYDNALYVVDLARWESVEDDIDGDSLNDEWRAISE
jgi:hypothetical protein